MYFDLNLAISELQPHERRECVAAALRLGFAGVAVNHTIRAPFSTSQLPALTRVDLGSLAAAYPESGIALSRIQVKRAIVQISGKTEMDDDAA